MIVKINDDGKNNVNDAIIITTNINNEYDDNNSNNDKNIKTNNLIFQSSDFIHDNLLCIFCCTKIHQNGKHIFKNI